MLNFKIISLLCCVAIVSVGFASWIITGVNIDNSTPAGNFTAYDSTDQNIDVAFVKWYNNVNATNSSGTEVALATGATVLFGKPATPASFGNPWLTMQGIENEQLKIALHFTVTNTTGAAYYLEFNISDYITNINTPVSYLSDLIDSKAIAEPTVYLYASSMGGGDPIATKAGSSFASGYTYEFAKDDTPSLDAVNYYLVIEFKWGTAGGNSSMKNPYDYYNTLGYSATVAGYAPLFNPTSGVKYGEDQTPLTVANRVAKAVLNDVFHAMKGPSNETTDDLKFGLVVTGGLGTAAV